MPARPLTRPSLEKPTVGKAEYTGNHQLQRHRRLPRAGHHVGDPEMKARDRIISVRGIDSIIARIRKG